MWSVLRKYSLPFTFASGRTSLTKLVPEDIAEAIDEVAETAIVETLRQAVENDDSASEQQKIYRKKVA